MRGGLLLGYFDGEVLGRVSEWCSFCVVLYLGHVGMRAGLLFVESLWGGRDWKVR